MQSRIHSAIEAVANTLIGLAVALIAQMIIYPIFGFYPSIGQNIQIAILFTAVSIVRSYALRRIFNRHSIKVQSKE